jgi:hypothetical protein
MRWPAKFVAKGGFMARGSKSKYTGKQKRKAEHIEEGYEKRGIGRKEAARRAWATVNKSSGGGKKSGSGRGKKGQQSKLTQRWKKRRPEEETLSLFRWPNPASRVPQLRDRGIPKRLP